MGFGLTKDGNPPATEPGFLRAALAAGVLGVDADTRPGAARVIPPLSEGCVCTRPCVACWSGLVKCDCHHEADVD